MGVDLQGGTHRLLVVFLRGEGKIRLTRGGEEAQTSVIEIIGKAGGIAFIDGRWEGHTTFPLTWKRSCAQRIH